jgi:diguanylate cyclase (GGDEF)-like protein
VNDTYGHPVGDEVLKKTAATMRETLRTYDGLARIGGEEFAILSPFEKRPDFMEMYEYCERLRETIQGIEHPSPNGESFNVTASIGMAFYPLRTSTHGDRITTPDELFNAADTSAYASKQAGRNKITLWTPDVGFGQQH